jgi:hypothetical protein
MRAANTLSPAETEGLLDVTVVTVQDLGHGATSYVSSVIPIITLTVGVMQIIIVSSCQQLKGVGILRLMEGRRTSNSSNLKSTKYR